MHAADMTCTNQHRPAFHGASQRQRFNYGMTI